MKFTLLTSCMALSAIVVSVSVANTGAVHSSINQSTTHGMAVAYPWVFQNGHDTSKTTAITSAEEIARKANFASVPADVAKAAWDKAGLPTPSVGHLPTAASLKKYGMALHANRVLYGSVSWHTRSIWVNAGPKTISTATVNVYVFDVRTGKIVFSKRGVTGRSDEKSNGYKIAADVLLTPLVTAVSGGPATPQEQRAVQIALGTAYHTWVTKSEAK